MNFDFERGTNITRPKAIIKKMPEDFIVEEIGVDGTVYEIGKHIEKPDIGDKFLHFILQKNDWSSDRAIKFLSKRLRSKQSRYNYAGTKDRRALTTQLVSGFAIKKENMERLKLKDIEINGMWYANEKVKIGNLLGNRFTLKLSDVTGDVSVINDIYEQLNCKIPNYFGEQRFGTVRKNTHIVGLHMLNNDYESAVKEYLTNIEGENHETASQARTQLKEDWDYAKAYNNFPKHLRIERILLNWLMTHENDYVNAIRKLPRNISLLFVHAFQSYLFNLELSDRLKAKQFEPLHNETTCGIDSYGFPNIDVKGDNFTCMNIIGYESTLNDFEQKMLDKFGLTTDNFRLNSLPELSSKGTKKIMRTPLINFLFDKDNNVFKFDLPSGCYATSVLREFIDYST